MRLVTFLSLVLGMVAGVNGAIVELKAVKVNDVPIAPTAKVSVLPGDTIEIDIFVSDWASELSEANGYEVTLDPASFVTGDSGVLVPIRHRGLMPLFNFCASDADCVPEAHCTGSDIAIDVCLPDDGCHSDADCLADEFCTVDQVCALDVSPNEGVPQVGVFIDEDRSDFLFAGLSTFSVVSLSESPRLRLGSGLLGNVNAVDNGTLQYVGTIIVEASTADSSYGESCGAFELRVLEHPYLSYLIFGPTSHGDEYAFLIPVSMSVNVSCVVGSCCDTFAASCMEQVGDLACQEDGQVFYPDLACSNVDCGPSIIPTVSEWGLLTLTLLLLTGVKLRFGLAFAKGKSYANADF